MLLGRFAPALTALVVSLAAPIALGSPAEPETVEIQRPSGPPILPPAPGDDPEVAPASEALSSETEVVEHVPAPVPAPAPAATTSPVLDHEPAGGADRWKRDYVRVQRPRMRGTGLMVTAGSLFATALAFQIGDWAICGNCARGLLERGFLLPAAVLAPIGAMMRGRSDAYRDTAARLPHRDTRSVVIGGLSLAAVGAAAGLANEIMWWQCIRNEKGPYVVDDDWWGCRHGVGRATLDLSFAAFTAGISMVAWGLRYRRDANVYRNARVTVAPHVTSREAMLTIAGRF